MLKIASVSELGSVMCYQSWRCIYS